MKPRASMLASILMLTLLGACKGSNDESSGAVGSSGASVNSAPQNAGGSGSAKVTYRPDVKIVEQKDGTRALISVSTDGSTLVFDRTRGVLPTLGAGDVLLIKGLLARRVLATEVSGDDVAVLTAPVALGEIIADGKISVHAPIRFGKPRSASVPPAPQSIWEQLADGVAQPLYAQSPEEVGAQDAQKKGVRDAYGNLAKAPFKALMSGWETQFAAEPADGRLNLTLQMKKSMAGVAAVIDGDGYLADFDFSSDIDVQRSTVEKMEATYKKLNGTMNFKWAIQTTADGRLLGNAKMKLPAVIEIPLYQYLGGLPLYLEVSAAVLIQPALNGEYEFSRGAFRVTYDGYQTFRVKEGNADADGNVTGDIKFGDVENGSGAPLGLVIAFAAPRIELSIGVSKVVPFDDAKNAAALADKFADQLISKVFGADGLAKFKSSPLSQVTATKIVETAMGSDAAAYVELTTSSGTSHSGSAAMVPCTRTDIHMWVKVGASAHAMGQSVGDANKEIFRKDFTRIFPSEDALCRNV
ncbi:MAG: hypothetical protein ABI311_06665 [Gemmatimonadaceae bacterium]